MDLPYKGRNVQRKLEMVTMPETDTVNGQACLCVKLQRCDKIFVSTCLGGGAVHAHIPSVKQEHVVSLCTYRQKVISRRIPLDIYCAAEWNKITSPCTLLLVSSYLYLIS